MNTVNTTNTITKMNQPTILDKILHVVTYIGSQILCTIVAFLLLSPFILIFEIVYNYTAVVLFIGLVIITIFVMKSITNAILAWIVALFRG